MLPNVKYVNLISLCSLFSWFFSHVPIFYWANLMKYSGDVRFRRSLFSTWMWYDLMHLCDWMAVAPFVIDRLLCRQRLFVSLFTTNTQRHQLQLRWPTTTTLQILSMLYKNVVHCIVKFVRLRSPTACWLPTKNHLHQLTDKLGLGCCWWWLRWWWSMVCLKIFNSNYDQHTTTICSRQSGSALFVAVVRGHAGRTPGRGLRSVL